jgi:hypothetical protein
LNWRLRSGVLSLMLNLGALAGVLLAISLGASSRRLWPAVDFLFASSAAAIYVEAVVHLARRRARHQRFAEVPRGIRLRRPVWMAIGDSLELLGLGASMGAGAAAAGSPGVGMGILLTFAAFCAAMQIMPFGTHESLTFEADGLRVHIRGASFLVRWEAITKVDRGGSETNRLVYVGMDDIRPVMRSVEPNTPRMRFRARVAMGDEEEPAGKLTFVPWTAGLDGTELARAIYAAIDRKVGHVN